MIWNCRLVICTLIEIVMFVFWWLLSLLSRDFVLSIGRREA